MLFFLGLMIISYILSLIVFTIYIYIIIICFFLKYSKELNEMGADKILLFNPLIFPDRKVRSILEKNVENNDFHKPLSKIKFYKFYAIIGIVITIPCMYLISQSNLGLY